MTFSPGSPATLSVNVAGLSRYVGQECQVVSVEGTYALVRFADGYERELPTAYLSPVKAACKPRRGVLAMKPDKDTRSESAKQKECVSWLQKRGYTVLVTGAFVKRMSCEKCGAWQFPHTGFGNAPGVPDVLFSHERWGIGPVWSVLEWKKDAKAKRNLLKVVK